jgi:hypothetical protein
MAWVTIPPLHPLPYPPPAVLWRKSLVMRPFKWRGQKLNRRDGKRANVRRGKGKWRRQEGK